MQLVFSKCALPFEVIIRNECLSFITKSFRIKYGSRTLETVLSGFASRELIKFNGVGP